MRRSFPIGVFLLAVLVLVLACAEEKEELPTPTPPPPVAETPTPTPTPAKLGPGSAGLPSEPRPVRGLEQWLVLDDGQAIWQERPANEDRTGVTADTIKFGRNAGITGPIAGYETYWGPFIAEVFKRINEAGGIHGRNLEIVTYDDQFNPAAAVQVVKQLVESDKVFALFAPVGCVTYDPVRDYLAENNVPVILFLCGLVPGQEPTTTRTAFPGIEPDLIHAASLAEFIYREDPDAKIAFVYLDNPAGKAALEGVQWVAQEHGQQLAGGFPHDVFQVDQTSIAQQVIERGANWVLYYGAEIYSRSLIRGLREVVGSDIPYVQRGMQADPALGALIEGMVTNVGRLNYYTNPDNPLFAALEKVTTEGRVPYHPLNTPVPYRLIEMLVRALELAGPDLTREGLIEAFETGFDGSWTCSLCDAPPILGPQDHWPFETLQQARWNAATSRYEIVSEVQDYETSEGRGIRGNVPGYECQPPSAEFPRGTCPWKEGS